MKLKNETIKEIQKVLTIAGNKEINDWQLAFKIANNNYKLMRAAEPGCQSRERHFEKIRRKR